ncbi:hypothetical protein YIM73052_11940 [Thermus antranikianii]
MTVHLVSPMTPEGAPGAVEFYESAHVPWRTLVVRGLSKGQVVDWMGPLMAQGEAVAQPEPKEHVLWGLPPWRRMVGPQSFLNPFPTDVVGYIAGACGGKVIPNLPQVPKRHYVLPRVAAWVGVRMVLEAWGLEGVLHETEDGALYVGPKGSSPNAGSTVRLKEEEVAVHRPMGQGIYYLKTRPLPQLRLYNRIMAPGGGGRVREHRLVLTPHAAYHEVFYEG